MSLSNCKPSKIWVFKGSKFYNELFKSWLQDNYIEIYSTINEGKSVVAERFIRILKDKIYMYVTTNFNFLSLELDNCSLLCNIKSFNTDIISKQK